MPGIDIPLAGASANLAFNIDARPPAAPGESPAADVNRVDPDFFRTLGIRLRQGRYFEMSDSAQAPGVAILNEAAVRRYWPDQNPIGQTITLGGKRQIVGIVSDVQYAAWKTKPGPAIYLPYAQFGASRLYFIVRTAGDPAALTPALRSQIRELDPNLPLYDIRTMDEVVERSISQPRFEMLLLSLFAAIALALGAVGIYGVISHLVTQRTQEIGIRMALGAAQANVISLVIREGLTLAAVGIGVGVAGALALTRLMTGLLYGISATDGLTFAAVAAGVLAVALAACYVPARRASRVEPLMALRAQ
ncbi:MAG: ABC transporter permease [Bryobacteraceae bacterium]